MDLFEHSCQEQIRSKAPLAARMRPRTLDEFVGQGHIVGEGRLLRRAIAADRLFSSLIFWGPPGAGKTTLATIVANTTAGHFEVISAVLAGVADLRRVIKEARDRRVMYGPSKATRTIMLVDEIHRWNRAQQDALLPHVEDGAITLIGATTENPYFEVIAPLVSRSRVFQFKPLTDDDVTAILQNGLADSERGYGARNVRLDEDALAHWVRVAGGDARAALNALELAVESTPPDKEGVIHITLAVAEDSIQQRALRYDKQGDNHYDTISAFIKSVRGSDPDAALYWLAKLVAAGEDPRFILRRLYILAAEDIGLADPNGIVVVNACAQAFEWVGMPEGQYHLAMATLYLATASKSNSAGAYWQALTEVKERDAGPAPIYLRDKGDVFHGKLREHYQRALGEHEAYKYPHDYPEGWVEQRYLPEGVEAGWFRPKGRGYERDIIERLKNQRKNVKRKGFT
ncbi:MAG: AAA family ATPase [Anaerolineaceae bacterium 4572_32.2]|nr:MAG: AAA family ATPase [Anaerolineaceae bacterium 4572_32.2]